MSATQKNPEVVRQQLAKILSSRRFVQSKRLSDFLRFIVEQHLNGKDSELKETSIAVEVFGRKPDYDSSQDSIVRTEAGRLRSKLIEYYAGEGIEDPLIIQLPKGGYIPVCRFSQVAEKDHENPSGRRLQSIATLVTVAFVFAVLGLWWVRQNKSPIEIAVLPLENVSGDSANDYFADGLTDELIRNLSLIEGLVVRSRTSSFALKGVHRNVRDVGKQLRVDYIVEGSVLREGHQLRMNAQLIRVQDDFPLWSGRFDRELTDILAIQDQISLGVVNNVRLKLGRGRRRYEASIEAYDSYLLARSLNPIWSIGAWEQVIAKDPSFAPAYAGIASAYALRSVQFPIDHSDDELSRMRAAAEKAIQLDPLLAEAHEALGLAYARDGKWKQAEESFRRSIDLDPNRPNTYADFGYWLLAVLGRLEDALKQLRMAQEMDPLSSSVHLFLPDVLIALDRYEEAADYCRKLAEDDPFRNPCLARAQLGRGGVDEALRFAADGRTSPNPLIRGFAGYIYARAGRADEARKLAAGANSANEQALIFAGLGDKDRTLEALDRMAALGAQRVGVFLNYPELSLLRGDPRLMALRKKIGLPE